MKKSPLLNHDMQKNLPDYNKLQSEAMKNNPSGGVEQNPVKGQSDFRGIPDKNLVNENNNDFNKNLNYRPKADTDEGSNKYEHLNGQFGKTNIKNTGMKDLNPDTLDENIKRESEL